jgi:hypothetical protein
MDDSPQFMKRPANRIATSSQGTPGVEGYVYEGADGSQMALHGAEVVAGTRQIRAFGGRRANRATEPAPS